MQCEDLKQVIDSYLSDELLVETNHEVQRHLDGCPACRMDLASRDSLRARLRSAIRTADESQIDSPFSARLARELRNSAHAQPRWRSILRATRPNALRFGYAVVLFIFVAGGASIYFRPFRGRGGETASQPSNTTVDARGAAQIVWHELAHTAIGDHENCAIKFSLAERPITLQAAALDHGQFNAELDKVITTALDQEFPGHPSDEFEFLESHYCIYAGQRFAHVVLRHKGRKVSILIADTASSDVDPVATEYLADGPGVSGFTVRGHAVFVVSDLPAETNSEIANALRSAVGTHAEKFGV